MTRQLRNHLALMLVALSVFTGCHPTQPFYAHEDGDLSHYIDRATEIEHPDVYEPTLEEVTHARAPFTLRDPGDAEFWDITLEEVISISLNNSKVIRNLGGVTQFGFADALVGRTASQTTVFDPALQETAVEQALSNFDARLRMFGTSGNNGLASTTDRPNNQLLNGINPVINDFRNGGLRTEIVKQSAVGTRLTVANQTDYSRFNGDINTTSRALASDWTTAFEVRFDQPLLGPSTNPLTGARTYKGTQLNRIPVVLSRINTDISLASFEASVRNLVLDIENTYWDLHCAYRRVETARAARDRAQQYWHQNLAQRGLKAGTQVESQSRGQYFTFRSALEDALTQLYQIESQLRFLMGLAATDGRLLRPKDEPTAARVDFDWHLIHAESLVRSAELRQQKWTIERQELSLILARNELLPQLDVGALYRWVGVGDELINADRNGLNFPAVGSTAFDELTEGNYQEASVFLNFLMPVGFRSALAGVRNAELLLSREKARLEDMELNTSHLLSSSIRELELRYTLAQTNFNRWMAFEEEYNVLWEKRNAPPPETSRPDLLLDSQQRLAQAQEDYYRSLCDYNKALAEVHFRKGSLLEYNNIMLAEGPWPDKAYYDALGRARERDASYYLDYGWTRPGVSSRGPAGQHMGEIGEIGDVIETVVSPDGEMIPAPEPMPLDNQPPSPEPLPMGPTGPADPTPRETGPITNRPEGPALNAPRRAAVERPAPNVARQSPNGFKWGSLGLGQKQPPKHAATTTKNNANPLRQANYEEPIR